MQEFQKTLELEDKYAHLAPILLGVAHEFRNPMQGIMASVAVLRTRLEEDATMRPFLDMIQTDTGRINDLINELLELTRPIQFDVKPHSITKILEDAIRSVDEETRNRHAHITFSADTELTLIRADGQMLSRAFSALLSNAIESADKNCNATVVLKSSPDSQTICIRDNGKGIPDENLTKIFEPFFSTRPKKAGLGMCIADRTIHAHKGNIQVRSEQGVGTEVIIILPVLS